MQPKLKLIYPSLIFLCIGFHMTALGQTITDSNLYHYSLENVNAFFSKKIKENLSLYFGNEYVNPSTMGQATSGLPYFLSDGFMEGSINYSGQFYDSVLLRFQLLEEDVIVNNPFTNIPIVLHNDKIDYFVINQHIFFKIPSEAALAIPTKKQFYEQLYKGKETIWAIREKHLELSIKPEDHSANYVEFNQYYLQKDKTFVSIKNKKELLNALSDQRLELKKFIRQEKLKFKASIENSIIKVVQYYDQIKNQ